MMGGGRNRYGHGVEAISTGEVSLLLWYCNCVRHSVKFSLYNNITQFFLIVYFFLAIQKNVVKIEFSPQKKIPRRAASLLGVQPPTGPKNNPC